MKKTFYIYDILTDEYVGEVEAFNCDQAELMALVKFPEACNPSIENLVAFSERY